MKIHFEDGSFIHLDEATNDNDKIVTITMCGLSDDGNKLTMSSSELDIEQVEEISDFFNKIIENIA